MLNYRNFKVLRDEKPELIITRENDEDRISRYSAPVFVEMSLGYVVARYEEIIENGEVLYKNWYDGGLTRYRAFDSDSWIPININLDTGQDSLSSCGIMVRYDDYDESYQEVLAEECDDDDDDEEESSDK